MESERERERETETETETETERERQKEREPDREKDREKDREGERERDIYVYICIQKTYAAPQGSQILRHPSEGSHMECRVLCSASGLRGRNFSCESIKSHRGRPLKI